MSDVGAELKAFLKRQQLPRLRPVSLLELGLVQVPVYSNVDDPLFAANLCPTVPLTLWRGTTEGQGQPYQGPWTGISSCRGNTASFHLLCQTSASLRTLCFPLDPKH